MITAGIYHNLEQWDFATHPVYKMTKDEADAVLKAIKFKRNFDALYHRYMNGESNILSEIAKNPEMIEKFQKCLQ